MGNVIGGADGEDPLVAAYQKGPFQEAGALIMEEVFIPAVLDQLWNHDDDTPFWMLCGEFGDVLTDLSSGNLDK
jgi:hypothetical protein